MDRYTEEQAKEMFEDLDYNDKMIEYRALYEKFKKRFNDFFMMDIFWTIVMIAFEIFASWNPDDKMLGILPSVCVFAVFLILSLTAMVKKFPEAYLLTSAEMIVSAIIVLTCPIFL